MKGIESLKLKCMKNEYTVYSRYKHGSVSFAEILITRIFLYRILGRPRKRLKWLKIAEDY